MSTPRLITFIRHAQQVNHTLDPEIKPVAIVPEYNCDYIITSPYLRCRQTSALFGKPTYVDVRLSEYISRKISGSMNPTSLVFGSIPIDMNYDDFTRRIDEAWNYILTLSGNVLLVTHGLVVKYLHEKLLGTSNWARGRDVPYLSGFSISIN